MIETKDIYDVHDFKTVLELSKDISVPIVFRNFRPNATDMWEKVYEEYKDHIFLQPEVEIKSFGNMFMPGTRTHVKKSRNITLEQVLAPESDGISYYISFGRFLKEDSISKLLGLVPNFFTADTNFISNFASDVTASILHSTTYVSSYSLQLIGRKLWIWVSPEEMENIGIISAHTANYPFQGSENDYFKQIKGLKYSLVEPGWDYPIDN
jgi:hypothetical protein